MHRSHLRAVLFDVPEPSFAPSVDFWSDALGRTPNRAPAEADPYLTLVPEVGGTRLSFQRIDGPARLHLDIETDDVEAEVSRLVALGAVVVDRVEDWVVLREPAGLLFCVTAVDSADFGSNATTWDGPEGQ